MPRPTPLAAYFFFFFFFIFFSSLAVSFVAFHFDLFAFDTAVVAVVEAFFVVDRAACQPSPHPLTEQVLVLDAGVGLRRVLIKSCDHTNTLYDYAMVVDKQARRTDSLEKYAWSA